MSKPMKEAELRKMVECKVCNQKIGQKATPILWKVQAERHGLDGNALQRQQGLTMMMGGSAMLAQVMGADEDMTQVLHEETCMICDECIIERLPELLQD